MSLPRRLSYRAVAGQTSFGGYSPAASSRGFFTHNRRTGVNEFETEIELAGETRPAHVSFDAVWGDIYLEKVEIALEVNETYTSLGLYSPRTERRWLDITSILSDCQALALVKAIKAAAEKARAEDYHDSDLQDWEERRRYARAA